MTSSSCSITSLPSTSRKNSRTPLPSLNELIAAGRHRLGDAGLSDEVALDSRLLAQHLLGWDHARLLSEGHLPASADFVSAYDAAIRRRAQREPLAYITGEKEFWGLTFSLTPDVLIPRPDTELLVEAALERTADADRVAVADVCTGSGCVAIAIARERRHARLIATDISEAALAIARLNASRHDVTQRVETRHADLLAGVSELFDMIVANPPYVRSGDQPALQPEVRNFEPAIALYGGEDGLTVIASLLEQAAARLRPAGWLLFEFGAGQDEAVDGLISSTPGLTMIDIKSDLRGIPRVAVARATPRA